MYTFTIPVGDWSDDGHGKCDHYIVECSHTPAECRKAYKDSCRLTGYQFHHNYPGLKKEGIEGTGLCEAYEDNTIPWEAIEVFREHGLDITALIEDDVEEGDDVYIYSEDMCALIMEFIGLSLTDFEWTKIQGPPPLFGYWSDELNVQMGYGCFS